MKNSVEIYEEIIELREKGYTQVEIAEKIGKTQPYVSQILNSKQKMAWLKSKDKSIRIDFIENIREQLEEIVNKVDFSKKKLNSYKNVDKENNLLFIPLFDMHFGKSGEEKERYTPVLNEFYNLKESYSNIHLVIGQDAIQINNSKKETYNGTQVESTSLQKAFTDALDFYENLIDILLEKGKNIVISFSEGNHDKDVTFLLYTFLERMYSNRVNFVTYDEMENFSVHVYENVGIGVTHGDLIKHNRITQVLLANYRKEFAQAELFEVHTGHLHNEKVLTKDGIIIRQHNTSCVTDKWHLRNGFVNRNKYFSYFVYGKDCLNSIHNINIKD